MSKQVLEAKVRARNKCNAKSVMLSQLLHKLFRPLVGHQIVKNDGGLLHRYRDLVPANPNTNEFSVIRHASKHSLVWEAKVCELTGDGGCIYESNMIYVGRLEGNVLAELGQPFVGRSDYSVEEVEQLRADYRRAKKSADDALSALYPFEEYDV